MKQKEKKQIKTQLKQVFDKVIKKSCSGVKYTNYIPRLIGKIDSLPNRKQRRFLDKMEHKVAKIVKRQKIETNYDEGKKLKRERIAKKYPQRSYLCKQRGCELRNRKGGFCSKHQGYK